MLSFPFVLRYLPTTVTMFHKYASYEEFREAGMFSSEANCQQFLLDMKILRTHHRCSRCLIQMTLRECSTTKYREGCCWKCKCEKTIACKTGSILERSNLTYEKFIKILAFFAEGKSVTSAAEHGNLAEGTVRRYYNKIYERMAQDLNTKTGPGIVAEWRKRKGLAATGSEAARQIFSKELPILLYYRNYC